MLHMRNSTSRIKTVRFYIAPSASRVFHERWLRFDHNAITLGKGVEIFNHVHTSRRRRAGDSDFQLKNQEGCDSACKEEQLIASACNGLNQKLVFPIRQ